MWDYLKYRIWPFQSRFIRKWQIKWEYLFWCPHTMQSDIACQWFETSKVISQYTTTRLSPTNSKVQVTSGNLGGKHLPACLIVDKILFYPDKSYERLRLRGWSWCRDQKACSSWTGKQWSGRGVRWAKTAAYESVLQWYSFPLHLFEIRDGLSWCSGVEGQSSSFRSRGVSASQSMRAQPHLRTDTWFSGMRR